MYIQGNWFSLTFSCFTMLFVKFCCLDIHTFSANFFGLKVNFRFLDVWVREMVWMMFTGCPLITLLLVVPHMLVL